MRNFFNCRLRGFPARYRLRSLALPHPRGHVGVLNLAASIDARTVLLVAAFIGPVALFIPWLSLDGHTGPLSGVGLMTYAFHGNDRLVMWRISPLATVAVMVVPFTVTVAVCLTTLNVVTRNHRLDAPLFTVAGVLLLSRFAPPILDGDSLTVWRFVVPGPGLFVLMVTGVAIVVCSGVMLWHGRPSNSAAR